jgi:hypothetical protein
MAPDRKTLCVDFDGVLHSYTSGWQGAGIVSDPPVEGAIEWLMEMTQERGIEVCIYSSRSREQDGVEAMMRWLVGNGLPLDLAARIKFPTQKPSAFLTIDDRCFRFEGDFPSYAWIQRFRPWQKWGAP